MNYPNDEDGQVLARIAASGMDLSKPTTIEYAIASNDESSSNAIADALSSSGFRPVVYYDEGEPDYNENDTAEFGPSWTVYVPVDCTPSYENVVSTQTKLNSIAQQFGGKVDGWELKLTKR
jgi:hypothetical protein